MTVPDPRPLDEATPPVGLVAHGSTVAEPDEATAGALAVFQNRPFLLLWLAQAATQIGGNMVLYGLTVMIFSLTGSASAVSLLILTFLVPAVLLSAVAGVYVDRLDRRLILIGSNLLRAVLFFLVFLVGGNVPAILGLNILISIVTTFFGPAEAAMIPFLVPRGQLLAANGVFTITMNAAFAVGFALFGPLVLQVASPQALLLVVAACYLVATVFTITLPAAPSGKGRLSAGEVVAGTERAVGSTIGQLREGVGYIRAHRNIAWSLVYLGITASLIGVLGVVGAKFAKQALGLAPKDFVVVVLPLGLGIVMGILILNSYGRYFRRRRIIEGGLISLGVLLGLIASAGPVTRFILRVADAASPIDVSSVVSLVSVVVSLAFLAGIAYSCVAIPAQTQLQEDLPEDVRGRVFGVLNMLISTASFLPIIIVGPIADLLGTGPVVLIVAVAIGVSGLTSAIARGRRLPIAAAGR